jgi:hypothetical protein
MFEDEIVGKSKEELIKMNDRINEIINELGCMGIDGCLGDIDEERVGLVCYIEENFELDNNEKELLGL